MKVGMWRQKGGVLEFTQIVDSIDGFGGVPTDLQAKYLGEINLPNPEKPKKTVTREAGLPSDEIIREDSVGFRRSFYIPRRAKNIRCTYEIDE